MRKRLIVVWPVQLQISFSKLSHKRHDFRKKGTENKMYDLNFSTTFVWNISQYKKKWARYDQKCTLVFIYSTLTLFL